MAAIVDTTYAAYDSYSSASSAPRTPSPHHHDPYPTVFSPETMHPDYPQPQQWNQDAFPFEHRESYSDAPPAKDPYAQEPPYQKPAQREPPAEHGPRSDYPPPMRRNTFPYVRHDREREDLPPMGGYSGFMHHQQPPPQVPNGMYGPESDYPPPPPQGGAPYHEYDQNYYRPHPSHYPHPMSMSHPMHHGHPLSMTYISPHTGLPVQHTDDAASKETQYLRRRCFNCHTTEPPSWRRSTLNPGKIVCNKCGLYERTHLRPRPLRFDELRAGNKARKTGPGAKGGKKGAPAPPPPQPPVAPNGGSPADDIVGKEPREFNLVRRSSVSSSGSSANGNSDWDSAYSSSSGSAPTSGPSTTFSSPASGHYPLPRDSHSPAGEGIRLPSAPMTDIGSHHGSPLVPHQSPHMMTHPPPAPPSNGTTHSPQLLHHTLANRSPPPRKSHMGPYSTNGNLGNGHYREMNGSSHSIHSNGDMAGNPIPLAAASPAGSS